MNEPNLPELASDDEDKASTPELSLEDLEACMCGKATEEQHARFCAEFDNPNSELNGLLNHIRNKPRARDHLPPHKRRDGAPEPTMNAGSEIRRSDLKRFFADEQISAVVRQRILYSLSNEPDGAAHRYLKTVQRKRRRPIEAEYRVISEDVKQNDNTN